MRKRIHKRRATWLAGVATIFSAGEGIIPYLDTVIPAGIFSALGIVFFCGSAISHHYQWGEDDNS